MALTSLATIKALLGISVSTYDVALQMLIDGVCEEVQRYCARQFEDADFIFKTTLDNCNEVVLDNHPVNSIYYAGTGKATALELTYSTGNAQASVSTIGDEGTLSLIAALTKTDLTLSFSDTLQDVATAIGLVAGWTATVTTGYENYPANCLLDQACETEETGTFVLYAATSPHRLSRGEVDGIYTLSGNALNEFFCNTDDQRPGVRNFVCLYNGGYATIPAGLTLIVNQICCDAWRNFNQNAAMKSETIGDYSYTKFDAAQIASAIGPYLSALDLYRRV
jgi:hypothetical protein